MSDSRSESYAAAGVDVTAGYEAVRRIRPLAEKTYIKGVLGGLGGFSGLFEPSLEGMKRPVLVSGTDGVGTKLKIAFLLDKHNTVGIDCVAMCVNDIVCQGALPLFFLDYLAVGKNDPAQVEAVVSGIADGCRQAGCALVGGETAEMPGFYPPGEYDLAGFSCGIADYDQLITGADLKEGDLLIGLSSSGLHSNGFSLVRKVFDVNEKTLSAYIPELSCTLGEELIKPTRIYVKTIWHLMHTVGIKIKAISHITGGGLYENVPRMMKPGLTASIRRHSFPTLPIFDIIQSQGKIPSRDMYNTFNMGIGMILAIDKNDVGAALDALVCCNERAYVIGCVVKGEDGIELC
ncbi:phosphoribosylformylglycinamidine cyclo-ligase [Papillibacter cinnamivorans]|uniref:Phosphoribosylformylglycinamidine cyclo-ligase n=1 Tax=Papillibacter cinnamivorans DSM 12816 TaxID=1122930 RepID=A0A1W1Z2N4_9FIRM|nr:phosphoribosylformylglycinamidine cyclo-ligase [Papillibacter cinnamivorans]SMC42572.1 phosphoribosylformylglycinamidine cyclo-ligase [Papillibacter cinnamivorans DSM 12816]